MMFIKYAPLFFLTALFFVGCGPIESESQISTKKTVQQHLNPSWDIDIDNVGNYSGDLVDIFSIKTSPTWDFYVILLKDSNNPDIEIALLIKDPPSGSPFLQEMMVENDSNNQGPDFHYSSSSSSNVNTFDLTSVDFQGEIEGDFKEQEYDVGLGNDFDFQLTFEGLFLTESQLPAPGDDSCPAYTFRGGSSSSDYIELGHGVKVGHLTFGTTTTSDDKIIITLQENYDVYDSPNVIANPFIVVPYFAEGWTGSLAVREFDFFNDNQTKRWQDAGGTFTVNQWADGLMEATYNDATAVYNFSSVDTVEINLNVPYPSYSKGYEGNCTSNFFGQDYDDCVAGCESDQAARESECRSKPTPVERQQCWSEANSKYAECLGGCAKDNK